MYLQIDLSDNDKIEIRQILLSEGLHLNEIFFRPNHRFFTMKDKGTIQAFFAFYNINVQNIPFMVLEYFWITPTKRKKGRFFKKIVMALVERLKLISIPSLILDVKKEYEPFITKFLNKKPYATKNNFVFYLTHLEHRILK